MIFILNGVHHEALPCPDGCPEDLHCWKCECGEEWSCEVLIAYEEGFQAGRLAGEAVSVNDL